MVKIITADEAAAMVNDGDTIMVGGFLAVGTPETICDALVRRNVKDLTMISNDNGWVDRGNGKLIVNKQCRKIYASYLGSNRETGRQINAGELEVELSPQGTLVERIRAGGLGLGGFYTPTGVGTEVAEGKEVKVLDGKEMILETGLRAKVALLKAFTADKYGNLRYQGNARNFNIQMAFAADVVIAEIDNLIDFMDPDQVETPGVVVDYIVRRGR